MADNRLKIRTGGQEYVLTLDLGSWMGDMLEELEDHLDGEPVIAWARRLGVAFERGVRISELRAKDILALVFMARSEQEPDITWRDVARTTAPYGVDISEVPADGKPADPRAGVESTATAAAAVGVSPVVAALAAARAEQAVAEPAEAQMARVAQALTEPEPAPAT